MIHGFRSAVAGFALLSLAALTACGGSDNARPAEVSGDIKIGLLAPLSGGDPETGRDAQRGAELASTLINAGTGWAGYQTGGIWGPSGGAHLSIVTLDTKNDRQHATDETDRLVTAEGVVGIVGAFDPDATLDASQRAERLQTPFVSGDAPLTALTERGLSWFFRPGPDTSDYGGAFLSLLRDAERPGQDRRRIALLYSNDATGNDLRASVGDFAEESGYQLAASVSYEPGAPDLRDAVSQVRAGSPDVVLVAAGPGQGRALGNAFRDEGYIPPAVVVYGDTSEADQLAAIPEFSGRVSRQVAWSMPIARANPFAASVTDRYQRDFGAPMTTEAASAFTAVTILAQAINNARSRQREQVRSALVALDLPGNSTIMPWNGVHFDGTHQNSLSATVIEQSTGGSFAPVYPRDLATTTVNWPPPGSGTATTGNTPMTSVSRARNR